MATPPPASSLQQAAGAGRSGGGGRQNNSTGRGGGRGRGGNHQNNNNNDGGGRGGGGRGGGRGRGGGGRNNGGGRDQGRGGGGGGGKHVRVIIKDVQLLDSTGAGDTPAQKAVTRIPARVFLKLRLQYLEPPSESFAPHAACTWVSDTRLEELQALSSKAIELGDVSKKNPSQNETAPALEDCKPLQVNNETRWKPKLMQGEEEKEKDDEKDNTMEEIMNKALLILNKVSWTTLERLTEKFIDDTQIAEKEDVRKAIIEMLVHKANTEPHFGPMYAQLCTIISKQIKPFKKELLSQCQKEFEMDTEHKIAKATQGVDDPDEQAYHAALVKKAYVGHMKFLGELYKRDVVKLSIMMHCLEELLKEENNEENLECFASLMTTMGHKLDDHAKQKKQPFDWSRVEVLRTSSKISNRIKFMLQDLLELKQNSKCNKHNRVKWVEICKRSDFMAEVCGSKDIFVLIFFYCSCRSDWVKRRAEESATTLDQIHKDIAKEEKQAKHGNNQNQTTQKRRVNSSNNLRRSSSLATEVDKDGFTSISRGSTPHVIGVSNAAPGLPLPPKPSAQQLRRTQSQPASSVTSSKTKSSSPAEGLLSPEECAKKTKNLFKEYFVGGDTDDAVLTMHEMISVGNDGSIERGAKVVEAGTLMIMEMKESDLTKFLTVMVRVVKESKIDKESPALGLRDPFEFLSDVEIDAPLARNHLASIVAEYMKLEMFELGLLKKAPEYFRTDGKPALLACKVLKKRGGDASDEEVKVVKELMTADDKRNYASAKDMIAA